MLIFLMGKFSKLATLGQLHCGTNEPYGRGIEILGCHLVTTWMIS